MNVTMLIEYGCVMTSPITSVCARFLAIFVRFSFSRAEPHDP